MKAIVTRYPEDNRPSSDLLKILNGLSFQSATMNPPAPDRWLNAAEAAALMGISLKQFNMRFAADPAFAEALGHRKVPGHSMRMFDRNKVLEYV